MYPNKNILTYLVSTYKDLLMILLHIFSSSLAKAGLIFSLYVATFGLFLIMDLTFGWEWTIKTNVITNGQLPHS